MPVIKMKVEVSVHVPDHPQMIEQLTSDLDGYIYDALNDSLPEVLFEASDSFAHGKGVGSIDDYGDVVVTRVE